MQILKHLSLAILLIGPSNGFGQWAEISNLGERSIQTLNFLDDNLGYTLMNDDTDNAPAIMKTADGGASWTELHLPTPTGEFQDLYFYAEGEGVILIRNLSNDVVPTKLFRTLDDGASWEDISPEATASGVGVGQCQFLSQDTGFFITDKALYTTTDGGEHWDSQEFNQYLLSISFLDAEHGVLGTWDGTFGYRGGMLATSDGGLTWTNTSLNGNYTSIMEVRQVRSSVALAAPVHSWAAIQAGQFYKTTDGGANWDVVDIPMPGDDFTLRQIDFLNEMNGVICVGNTTTTNIYRTTDGGQTWIEEGMITSTFDTDLQLTPNSGYIGGKTGSFYKRSGSTSAKEAPLEVDITLFPSPAKSGQTISWSSPEKFTRLLITGPTGRTIHQQYLDRDQATLPPLDPGLYFVQLFNEKGYATAKLIVE